MKRLAFALKDVAIPIGLLMSLLRYRLYDAETAIRSLRERVDALCNVVKDRLGIDVPGLVAVIS